MSLTRALTNSWRYSLIAFSMIAVLALASAACGDDDDDDDAESEATEEETEEAEETAVAEEPTEEATEEGTAAEATADEEAPADFDEEAVADFYSGQTVTMIVGVSAGGGFDTQARLIAEHLGQYIPGNPTVIVENMPGAGSLVAWNHVYNAAPQDGTVISYSIGAQILQQILGNPAAEFDAAEFQYLGAITQDEFLLPVTSGSGLTSFEQVLPPDSEELIMGGTAAGSSDTDIPNILREVLGANVNVVTGYDGTSNVVLAMESGELDGVIVGLSSAQSAFGEQFENDWNILVTLTAEQMEELPDVPPILDFVDDEESEQIVRLGAIDPGQYIRPLTAGPEVPEDRVLALARAIELLLEDEEFLAAATEQGTVINPLTAQELTDIIAAAIGMPEGVKARLQELLLVS
ncbi:MAG: hypothetical protein GEU28_04945 [Dehalococcoidia bacterium]|nr:hypothetical protein [Dehalococcoidia bacterium]